MILFPIGAWARIDTSFDITRSAVCLSRILLLLAAIELITMPITQQLWTWDRFLHGGQDFELGLLIIVTCLCLILLRTEQNRRHLGVLLAIKALSLNFRRCTTSALAAFRLSSDHWPRLPSRFRAGSFNLPLLI